MKRIFPTFLGLLVACFFAGCATGKAPTTRLEDTDQFKVDLAVYGFLLNRQFGESGEYSAIFLQGDDAEVTAVSRQFPQHVPPIKPSYRANVQPNRTPLDRDTGKRAVILSVDATEATDAKCEAIGRWYAGPAVTGFHTFELKKSGDDWVIESSH